MQNPVVKTLLITIFILKSLFAFSQAKSEIITNSVTTSNPQFDKYIGKSFPNFSIKLIDSTFFSNKNFIDKIVFINFWNVHCSPCIAEMNGLNQMYQKLNKNPDFLFVSFSNDPDSVIKKSVIKNKIQFKVFKLSNETFSKLNFNKGIPANFILDKKGEIRYFKSGGYTDKNKATDNILNVIYPKLTELIEQ